MTLSKKCLTCKRILIKRQKKFCSKHCAGIDKTDQIKKVAFSRRNRIGYMCSVCGKKFFLRPSDIKQGRGKYCSYACKGEIQKNHIPWNMGLKARDNPRLARALELAHKALRNKTPWNKGIIIKLKKKKICEICHKVFMTNKKDRRYCGTYCSSRARSRARKNN